MYASADGILWGGRGHHCDPHHPSSYHRQQPDMHRGNDLAVNEIMYGWPYSLQFRLFGMHDVLMLHRVSGDLSDQTSL